MSRLVSPPSRRARLPPARTAPKRFGKPLPPRQTERPTPPLATRSAARSSPASLASPAKSSWRSVSSRFPLILVQKTAQLLQLLLRRSPALQRVAHQLACPPRKPSLPLAP